LFKSRALMKWAEIDVQQPGAGGIRSCYGFTDVASVHLFFLEPVSKFNFPDMRSVYVGPAPRREDVWPEIRSEALFFPGEAPVLPVLARAAPVPVIKSPISR
jgi:hypothetical protein